MLERTRKPSTDAVTLAFTGPAGQKNEALKAMLDLGFSVNRDSEGAVPWSEALGYSEGEVPGVCLRGARYREDMTQAELSEKTGIPIRHISEMENGKRTIGKAMAKRLGEALNVGYRIFL